MQTSKYSTGSLKRRLRWLTVSKIITILLLIITLSMLGVIFFSKLYLSNVINNSKYSLDKPISLLLTGTDYSTKRDPSEGGVRSDTVMVATLTSNNSRGNIEADLVSIPRDTIVRDICSSNNGVYDKLTNTTSTGFIKNQNIDEGIECTKSSVEDLLNIEIDYYVSSGFDGIIDLVNAVGGITVDVPYDFCEQNEKDQGASEDSQVCGEGAYYFKKGSQNLTGEEALSYARQRHASSDYDRNIRQQQVMTTVIKKILKDPVKYSPQFIQIFNKDFQSSMPISLIESLLNFATNTYNTASLNMSSNVPTILDIKSSPYQNITETESIEAETSNIVGDAITTYYSDDTIQDFERDIEVKRNIFTKEGLKSSSATSSPKGGEETVDKSNQIHIELSMYSMEATAKIINGGYYSYPTYNVLNFTSNQLRTSLGLDVAAPTFDYIAADIPDEASSSNSSNSADGDDYLYTDDDMVADVSPYEEEETS